MSLSAEWIDKKERLPTKDDADRYGFVLGIGFDVRQHAVTPYGHRTLSELHALDAIAETSKP